MSTAEIGERRTSLPAQFGIGRAELDRLGLPQTQFLGLPTSVVLASVAINILGLAMPLGILQVYDRIIPHRSTETLLALVVALFVVALIEAGLRVGRGYVVAWSAARFSQVSMIEAYSRILFAPRELHAAHPPARLMQMMSSVQRLGDFFGGRSRLLVLDLPFVGIFLVMIAMIGGWLVVVALAVLLVFAVVTMRLGRTLKAMLESRDQQDAKIYDFISDSLSGITTLKGLAMEALMLRRFERLQASAAQIDYRSIEAALLAESTVTTLGNVTMIAMVTFGAWLAVDGRLTIGMLSACTLLSGRVIQPILGAASLWNEVQKMRLGLESIEQVFALQRPALVEQDEADGPVAVAFRSVSLTTASGTLFENLDWAVEAGAVALLVGPDGSGKSNLLRLAAGETTPHVGTATVGGIDAQAFRATRVGAVVLVPQNPSFFRGSILENLTLFGGGPTPDQVRRATRLIDLEKEIDRLPLGYDTRLGEGISETLPLGFLKRLSIARALALGPRLLILDEPQAFLDTEADKRLIESIARLAGHVTVLMTSSRPSYAAAATEIWHCEAGRLARVERPAPPPPGAPATPPAVPPASRPETSP
ncbi:ABC transporter transmembrane domain-containing protein [Prosthecomicrobium sp. N25]|uniref:ABC transporter transmembrane domain-containing protein n=1 Tax=Prosthecomicrobium sp. N25 TaxID=3129254 RepID=UPI00307871AE